MASLRDGWRRLAERERRLVTLALVVVLAALLWVVGIAPALGILRSAPARLVQLDQQLQSMQAMQAQARAMQGRAPVARDEAARAVEAAMQQRLRGQAQVSRSGDRMTVTVSGVPSQALAQWLAQVRDASRVVVQQSRLVRTGAGWDGSIVLQLPAP